MRAPTAVRAARPCPLVVAFVVSFVVSVVLAVGLASGQAVAADEAASRPTAEPVVAPPASEKGYIQYGVALTAESVASPGPACADVNSRCILGSGGGIAVRFGWRPKENFYLGGAYAMSKQEPHQLYRVAILQQGRVEGRWYFPTGREAAPFALVGAGIGGYGNEWSIDTWGPSATLGGGIEVQLGGPVLVVSLAYRPMYFRAWSDSSALSHDAGIAHFVGFEVALEAQDALQGAP